MSHEIPSRAWSKVATDLFMLNRQNFLITVDFYSDFWELDKLEDISSATIIGCLKVHYARHGAPETLVSDNGPQFSSDKFAKFARDWEFMHVTSSPYHSRANGKAEAVVKQGHTAICPPPIIQSVLARTCYIVCYSDEKDY